MDMQTILPFLVFGAITAGVWALINAFSGKDNRVDERLDELRDPRKRKENEEANGKATGTGVSSAFKKAAPALSKAFQPKTDLEQSNLKVRLANAGFASANAVTFYLATKMAVTAVGFLLGGGYAVVIQGMNYGGLASVIIGAGLGMYLPELVLMVLIAQRKERIFLTLPDALDLMVVCVEAGLGLDAAIRRVAEELDETAPDLCQELAMCNLQQQMGRARREVLHDLGVRTGVDDVRALSAILIQAEKFGSSVGQALRVQSESMRVKRSQLAEEKAAKTAVKMIFPLVLFIFPGIFVVLVGPAAIMMMRNLLNT
ncbi:MAG: type II secretion system F family protein [Planctomycetaceae bacterium]|nr:type II secretion system F family protein [Planctomycetaceae bacterium]